MPSATSDLISSKKFFKMSSNSEVIAYKMGWVEMIEDGKQDCSDHYV